MNKERLCEYFYSLFPNLDKKDIENDVVQGLEDNLNDYTAVQRLLISKYESKNNITYNNHFLCAVCGEFVTYEVCFM
jgi:hypothetical protein